MAKKESSFFFLVIFLLRESYSSQQDVDRSINNSLPSSNFIGNEFSPSNATNQNVTLPLPLEINRTFEHEEDTKSRRNIRHVKGDSFSSFGQERPDRRRPYLVAGAWATPAPDSGIDLGFTPVQTYIQVRKTNNVLRLPRSEAYKESTSPDELANAHRLKEVLRTKKIQEVYSEEGYEDSAYDHGSHERHAEHDEGVQKHRRGRYRTKEPVRHHIDAADAASSVVEINSKNPKKKSSKVNRKKVETANTHISYLRESKYDSNPKNKENKRYESPAKKYSSKTKTSNKREFASQKADIWNFPTPFDDIAGVNKWSANFEPMIHSSTDKANLLKSKQHLPSHNTFGFIHSLTDAHYGGQTPTVRYPPKSISSHVINLTDSLKPSLNETFPGFEPKRLGKRVKRETESEQYEKKLSEELDFLGKDIIESSLGGFKGFQPPRLNEMKFVDNPIPNPVHDFKPVFDTAKYPYYYRKDIDPYSPLRFASNSDLFPEKSGTDMEFYRSRDEAVSCDPISVSLDDVPKGESTRNLAEQPGEKKRIVKLGDKIKCMKNKYFDEDPLDSPFFKEDELKAAKKYHSRSDDGIKFQPNQTVNVFSNERINDSKIDASQERYKYQTIHVQPQQQLYNSSVEDFRVIPVSEPEITTLAPIMGMKPPPRVPPFLPFSIIRLPPKPKPAKIRKKIQYKYNCLQPISKYTVSTLLKRSDDVVYDCRDVTLIHTNRNGNSHFQIIPKLRRSAMLDPFMDETYSIRAGEVVESRRKRAADEANQRRKSNLFPNRSYLDRIIRRPNPKKDDEIGKPTTTDRTVAISTETVTTTSTTTTIRPTTTTARPTTSTTTVKQFNPTIKPRKTTTSTTGSPISFDQVPKKLQSRPLKRLSGQDFLNRYHKAKQTKSLGRQDPSMFWEVIKPVDPSRLQPGSRKIKRDDHATQYGPRINRRIDPSASLPTLLYIVDEITGRGRWVSLHE